SVLTSPMTAPSEVVWATEPAVVMGPRTDFKIPGVLYTWAEVTHPEYGATFDASRRSTFVILRWARFVAFPVVALVLALLIQTKSSRGLRMALGEVEFDVS